MARGNGFTTAALNINIGANSAQLSAAIDKAKAMVQGFSQHSANSLQKLSKAFSAVGSAAMGMGPHIANAAGTVARSTAWATAGLSVYTAAVVVNRLEQEKLAKQFNLSTEQMNSLAYMAKYAGQETEDFADALKELSIKAGDAVESGEKMADTMGVLFDKMGGAKKWVGENDPIKKLYALREAYQQLSLADQVRVADEMGDAGLKLISTLKLTNAEFEMLRKTGEATAGAMNVSAIQTLISKFGYLQQVGNDFLTGIVARFAPLFSMIVDDWTKKLTRAFEDKGGFKEGFESYVDLWADRIFNFLTSTIQGVADFVDTLRGFSQNMLSAYNATANFANNATFGQASLGFSQRYDASALQGNDLKMHNEINSALEKRRVLEDQINLKTREASVYEGKAGANWFSDDAKRAKAIKAEAAALQEKLDLLPSVNELNNKVEILNTKHDLAFDPHKYGSAAKSAINDAKAKWEETKNAPKPKDEPNIQHKPTNSISEQAYTNSQSEANAKAKADLEKSTAALEAKLQSQLKKIQTIRDKFKLDQQAEWDRTVNAEKQELSDSFIDAEQMINDHYAERLKTVKAGSAEELKLKRELNDKKMNLALIQSEAEKQLEEEQAKRRKYESSELMRDMLKRHEEVMTKLGKRGVGGIQGGTVGKQNQIREETKAVADEYDNQLKVLKDKFGEQSTEYQTMLDDKLEALKAYHAKEAALIAAQGEGVGHDIRRMYTAAFGPGGMEEAFSERQSVVEGYTNAEIGMMKSHSDEIKGNDAEAIAQREQMDKDAQNARLMFMADGMSQMAAMGAKHNKALFYMQKAIALGMIALNTMMGASEAMKLGPTGIPMVPMFYAMGAAQAATVLATTFIQGQAHDGLDYIPAEGTWNLQKGERVVGAPLNVSLGQAVDKINSQQFSTAGKTIKIDAPVIIQGSILDQGAVADALSQHKDHIANLVSEYHEDRGNKM
ncbi:hypothetical protein [Aeromonas dhakensis]|uniref:hypothetical protein n=1 Tax=Aeromonas dhakensis TaxID=196024 RepID=UPI00301C4AE0